MLTVFVADMLFTDEDKGMINLLRHKFREQKLLFHWVIS